VATAALESEFVALLERLQPKPGLMKLFRAIVLDVWQERHAIADHLVADLSEKLSRLQQREALVDEAFLYRKEIDRATFERQRDKLRENIALVRIDVEDAKLDEIDIEGLLGFAEHVLTNAAPVD
jgi:hypothetical protein